MCARLYASRFTLGANGGAGMGTAKGEGVALNDARHSTQVRPVTLRFLIIPASSLKT